MISPAPGAGGEVETREAWVPRLLRRGVLAGGAALLVVLAQETTNASYVGTPGIPGPLTVVVIGLAFLLMPVLLVASWVAGGRVRLPHPWLAVPAGLFVVGAAVSTVFAADKASALVRSAELAGIWVGFWALAQAIRTDAERRFLLAALLATAVLAAALAIFQASAGMEATWHYYQAHRDEILAAQGIERDSPAERLLLERFTGGVQATLGHPNVLASFLVLGALVALGLAAEKAWECGTRAGRYLAVGMLLAAGLCAAGIVLAQSRGGIAAAVAGVYFLAVARWVRRPRLRWALWLLPVVAGAAALAAAGRIDHPAVASALKTLRYRLDYWQGTVPILRTKWLTGVGLENFSLHYVTHKLPTSPEEVQDPHNMWLSAWSQLGVAGLLALVSAVILGVRSWCRAPDAVQPAPPADARGGAIAGLVAAAALLAVPGAIGFFLLGPHLGVVALGLVAVVTVLAAAENPRRLEAPDRPLRALRAACMAGLAAFWIAEQIGTAVLDPPTAWAMLLVLAVSLGPGRDGARREGTAIGPAAKFALMALAMAACYAYVLYVVLPIAREDALVAVAAETTDPDSHDEVLQAAAKANLLAWEPAYRRGQVWEAVGTSEAGMAIVALERAITAYQEALARQPRLWKAYVALARCRLAVPGASEDAEALAAARQWLEAALRLYPTHVRTRRLLAEVLDRSKAYPDAVREYERVQELDRLMPGAVQRLRDDDRRAVEERLRQLREPLATEPAKP